MLLLKYLSMHLKSKMQYKLSFFLILIAQGLLIITSGIGMYSLFDRFGGIKGFTLYEVVICFVIVELGFTMAQTFGRGFDSFSKLIKMGTFDLLIIRPRSIYLQIIGSNIAYEKIGKGISCIAILTLALYKIDLVSPVRLWFLLLMLIGSVIIFISTFIIGAGLSFYTIEGLEVVNILSNGTKEVAQYPIGIYGKKMLFFFTFFVPLSCVNFYPLLYVIGKSDKLIYAFLPLSAIILLIPSILVFNRGLRNYQGTGS